MNCIARSLVLLFVVGSCTMIASRRSSKVQDVHKKSFDDFYKKSVESPIETEIGYPNRRRTQLYSRNTGRFVQVLRKGKVVAKGIDGNKYADLEILTVSFGRVHIKGLALSLYVCFDKRGRLIAKRRPTLGCVFHEKHGPDAYNVYESQQFKGKYLAFTKKGMYRHRVKSKLGTKPVQFVERPRSTVIRNTRNLRYYTSLPKGRRQPIKPWEFDEHKRKAKKMLKLFSQNNSPLNPVVNQRKNKKTQKNANKKLNKKKNGHSKKNSKKLVGQKGASRVFEYNRFPPKNRLHGKVALKKKSKDNRNN